MPKNRIITKQQLLDRISDILDSTPLSVDGSVYLDVWQPFGDGSVEITVRNSEAAIGEVASETFVLTLTRKKA